MGKIEDFIMIPDVDKMPSFFINMVSASNLWMFLSSNGGVTAGRINADHSLFPYYTDDKITDSSEITGSKTILRVKVPDGFVVWEPFSARSEALYHLRRNIYKSTLGNEVLFEEINDTLGLSFSYKWSTSDKFGFVRKVTLTNLSDSQNNVEILDGMQNILPSCVPSSLQTTTSNLVDAYKRSELEPSSGIGIFGLGAVIVDKAEPSEALKANIAWSLGLDAKVHLLSSKQLSAFRAGESVEEETDVTGERGAYFILSETALNPKSKKEWMIMADVDKDRSDVVKIKHFISDEADRQALILNDVDKDSATLFGLVASADGVQLTSDRSKNLRHFSNTLFNIMRGGVFSDNYNITKTDLLKYLHLMDSVRYEEFAKKLKPLPETIILTELTYFADKCADRDLVRHLVEYLPLMFSRRHGDPSRPCNLFSINTKDKADGTKVLDYEGNWRDIFQNWEALAVSFPQFLDGMIFKFLNASTFDGYNPYRVSKKGFDWESADPDNPWSYIGYWGDHQVIYLLKLLESQQKHYPGQFAKYLDKPLFVFANVPYRIKQYSDILKNPKDTIVFDAELDKNLRKAVADQGSDAALLKDHCGNIVRVNLLEKILTMILAKLSNYIPDGGIWMNTQRPEWNDANNALVGNGISMVTLYYLRRFLKFIEKMLGSIEDAEIKISDELAIWLYGTNQVFNISMPFLKTGFDGKERKKVMDALGGFASEYRQKVYEKSFSGIRQSVRIGEVLDFVRIALRHLDYSIAANRRDYALYNSYNLVSGLEGSVEVSHLGIMLEGQVAVLSSGYLSGPESLALLESMKGSQLYREDQSSYMLYPVKDLPGFMRKNEIPTEIVSRSELLTKMIESEDKRIIMKDIEGKYHFNSDFRNANDLSSAMAAIGCSEQDAKSVLEIFEAVFHHKEFTGRSGNFFAYEGLGSIYWHMVSKLLLAVEECCLNASSEDSKTKEGLYKCFHEIQEGLGVHKSPKLYGAFPTDPYSHTPAGKGARQPGMTGQVKEDILSRFGELGVEVEDGKIVFNPELLERKEFLQEPADFEFVTVGGVNSKIGLIKGQLAFTYCGVPVVYELSAKDSLTVHYSNGCMDHIAGNTMPKEIADHIFSREGKISQITVSVKTN